MYKMKEEYKRTERITVNRTIKILSYKCPLILVLLNSPTLLHVVVLILSGSPTILIGIEEL